MLRVCVVQGRDLPQADFATGASDPVRVLKINIFGSRRVRGSSKTCSVLGL